MTAPAVSAADRVLRIAASHADAAAETCVVIEELLVPGEPAGWGPPLWRALVLRRPHGVWQVVRSAADELGTELPEELCELGRTADLVLVDGPQPTELTAQLARALPGRRVAQVDPVLVARHGDRYVPRTSLDFGFPPPPEPSRRRGPRLLVAAVVVVVVALGLVGVVARWPRQAAADVAAARVGPVEVTVPGGWRRTELSGDRPDDGRGLRAVFAAGEDGRRLIVVVTALRAGSDRAAVAASLAHRIAQRGDEVVVEFAASSTYGGRQVISYREAPVSGAAVRWYVVVDGGLQISVGCQEGTGGHRIDEACRRAVGSARIVGG
ncbi:type VII secretion-associated protein [Gordonia phosphorivorans]|uniref:Type VII secretion-associated protein n=1 Tax=Gordonia phosphorivorans TaxID=1056982 RepID=A0ABV6H7S2_9ACTN